MRGQQKQLADKAEGQKCSSRYKLQVSRMQRNEMVTVFANRKRILLRTILKRIKELLEIKIIISELESLV